MNISTKYLGLTLKNPIIVGASNLVTDIEMLKKLEEAGVIFCPISEAVQKHPELVQKYLGTVIPMDDHKFSALNSAVFTDGSF
ncbi:MAG TPA: Fe-S cluster assembly protein SufB, partial [Bacteroidales bacterium]|nr:Fe-S cluster assembly protein SufB [Bacteroidales bacterium]